MRGGLRTPIGLLATLLVLSACGGAGGGSAPQEFRRGVCDGFRSVAVARDHAVDITAEGASAFSVSSKANLVRNEAQKALRTLEGVEEWEPGAPLLESLRAAATAYSDFAPAFRSAHSSQDEAALADAREQFDAAQASYDAAIAAEAELSGQGWSPCIVE